MKKFVFLEHVADIKFQAFGKSLEEVFKNSVLALKESITKGINKEINPGINRKIKIKGIDNESLLYNFLEEFLYLIDAENFLLSKIKSIKIINNKLESEVVGDKASNYKFTNDIKAVTYNEMFVKQDGNNWVAQVVLDA
jgi:SHS2 domain-containing protein